MKLTLSLLVLVAAPTLFGAAEDMEEAFQNLKQAVEGKKDPAEVKKLAEETYALAHEITEGQGAARAREVEVYTEYALYATAVQAPPAAAVDLFSALEAQNPKSKYLETGYTRYLAALNQTGGASKIPAIAEKALANFPNNLDLLLLVVDSARSRKQNDRALNFAKRLVAVAEKKPAKPEDVPPADWERKLRTALGTGHWIAGMVSYEKQQFYAADKELRAALPLIKGNDALMGPALFSLGVANYQLGKQMNKKALVLEAAQFSEQAAALGGQLGQEAWRNAQLMKTDAGKMR